MPCLAAKGRRHDDARDIRKRKAPGRANDRRPVENWEAIDNRLIANLSNDDNRIVAFRSAGGATWSYRGKRGRVLAMLASMGEGVMQWDTLPWHTRLGGSIHAMRRDGLAISTELEGEYRHARYRLAVAGCLIIQAGNRQVVR